MNVTKRSGKVEQYNEKKITKNAKRACKGLDCTDPNVVVMNAQLKLYEGVTTNEIDESLIKSACGLIEQEPNYRFVAARLLLGTIYKEVFGEGVDSDAFDYQYRQSFLKNLKELIKTKILREDLKTLDLKKIAQALKPERDFQFAYIGLQTAKDRYLIKKADKLLESPQAWLMRVAMGLAIAEKEEDRTEWAIKFYDKLSSFDYMTSTPTLFYSGNVRNQLSSCFLSTFEDSIYGIFDGLHQEAQKSKFAGGLGMDFTPFRAGGAYINGTNGYTQGSVYFWKLFNDMLVAVQQCFEGSTKVITQNGVKQISDITTDDRVQVAGGGFRPVIEQFVYDAKDRNDTKFNAVSIRLARRFNRVNVTTGHPFLAITRSNNESIDLRGWGYNRIKKNIEKGILKIDWVESGKLIPGQYVAFSTKAEVTSLGWSTDDAYFYGLMLGDGWVRNNNVEAGICFNKETNIAQIEFVRNYLTDLGVKYRESSNTEDRKCHTSDKYYSIVWSWPSVASKFKFTNLYNSKREKTILPEYLTMEPHLTDHIIKGLVYSDGHIETKTSEVAIYNNSSDLVDCIKVILLRRGIMCGVGRNMGKVGGNAKLPGIKNVDSNDSYVVRVPTYPSLAAELNIIPSIRKAWFEYNDWIFTYVKDIEPTQIADKVYDLKVMGDESYVTLDAGIAHNGGRRQGAGCGYLETWHADIEDFLELRKNVGEDRRRTHDMNTANWIPDLFIKQVNCDGDWYLFSPDETPELHDLFGVEFEKKYNEYVAKGKRGELRIFKHTSAKELWKKMLKALFETGHPWITFKDPCNIRYSNQHDGVVHSSNLCLAGDTIIDCIIDGQVSKLPLVEIVNLYQHNKQIKVLSFNTETNVYEYKLITAGALMNVSAETLTITDTASGKSITCTPDHQIYTTNRGYVAAADLEEDDKLVFS